MVTCSHLVTIFVIHLLFLTFSHSTNHYSPSKISHGSELRTNSSSSSPWKQWDNSRFPGVTGGWASQSFFPFLSLSHAVIHIHPLSAHRSPLETMPVSTHGAPLIATTPQKPQKLSGVAALTTDWTNSCPGHISHQESRRNDYSHKEPKVFKKMMRNK